jgi:SAM-dependent methyltransferase
MPWREQVERGALVCPKSLSRLHPSADGKSLTAETGGAVYPLVAGRIPALLPDAERIGKYLSTSEMVREYGTVDAGHGPDPVSPKPKGIKGWLEGQLSENYRSQASLAAFAKTFPQALGSLYLSIGGGPHRDHPAFVNLNLGPFPNVEVIADAHRLPYADGSVDRIYCSAVMEHLYDPPRAVREMLRVLKPGGEAYVRTPFLQPYHGYPHHYQNFTLTGHVRIFEDAGFKVLESGTDVGPTYTLVHMLQTYAQTYFPGLWIKPVRIFWALVGHVLLKRLDKGINSKASAFEMASTTYLVVRK